MSQNDPIDTIRVRGGSGLSKPDTEVMRQVCAWLAQACDAGNRAVSMLGVARDNLNQAAQAWLAQALTINVVPPANATPGLKLTASQTANLGWEWQTARAEADRQRTELQNKAVRARAVADQANTVRQSLNQFVAEAAKAKTSLLKAAAIYENAETRVLSEFKRPTHLVQFLLSGGKFSEWIIPAVSPYSDELISALSWGLALNPFSIFFGGQEVAKAYLHPTTGVMVPLAAGLLGKLAHTIVPKTVLSVTEIVPGHGPLLGCPSPMPSWQGIPSGTVLQLLNRVGDLHPFDPNGPPINQYPDCARSDLPKGTIAIERIQSGRSQADLASGLAVAPHLLVDGEVDLAQNGVNQNGSTKWVVLIPGTQNFTPGNHAFDGVTDLDLMAGGNSQVNEQVMKGLALVGAQKGEPVVLVGHSLGGIAAASIAASTQFNALYDLGGVITVGSPTATFRTVPGVPYLHVENDEEIVSNLDGKSGDEAPTGEKRVTVTRQLSASDDPVDQKASRSLTGAHPIETHQRTLELALESGNPAVHNIVNELEGLLTGESSETRFFTGRREPVPK